VADAQGGNATRVADAVDEFPPDQVDRQAALLSGTSALTYPEPLRRSRVGGQVVAIFIVETDGHVEADSVHFARSDNALFEEVVLTALQRMRFSPAEIGGRKVRQLVQMPFVFAIRK
jgi:protein TonB